MVKVIMKSIVKRSVIAVAIFSLFVFFIYRNFGVLEETYNTTVSHMTSILFLAFFSMVACYFFVTKMYIKTFGMVGLKRTFWRMLPLTFEALAINLIIPTAGVSMAVLFSDDAKENGDSGAQAVNAVFMTFLVDYTAISLLLLLALMFLYATNSLTPSVYIPAIFFFLLTFGTYLLTLLATKTPKFVKWILRLLFKVVTPILHLFKKEFNESKHTESFIRELSAANAAIFKNPIDLLEAVLLALGVHFMRLVTLYIIFISIGIEPLYRTVLAGYSIGALFIVVSPTPNGVGFVEGSMALVFSSLGIPLAAATTATVIYRAFEFWMPFGIGFFLLQRDRIKKISEETFV